MSTVFISYRRSDSEDVTGRIYEHLLGYFGEGTVFKDVDSIPLGADFRTAIDQAIQSSDVLLVVIGPEWIDTTDEKRVRRIDNADDYVRLEVEAALKREMPVIPVLVKGAQVPSELQLPTSLGPLAYRNAAKVRSDPDFAADIERLVRCLERIIATASQTDHPKARSLVEYLFVDRPRLIRYIEQIKGRAALMGRDYSDHEMIEVLTNHLKSNDQLALERPQDSYDSDADDCRPFVWEEILASKAIIPAASSSKVQGLKGIAVWVSDPVPTKNRRGGREGTFLFLIESYWERDEFGQLGSSLYPCGWSQYSALQWIIEELVKAEVVPESVKANDKYGLHPIERFKRLGAIIQPARRLRTLYRKRLISDNSAVETSTVFGLRATKREHNDLVGYPIFLAAV
ncbi:MAG: toll/interleukin-1 receptor domain-containing protein [Pirellulaceae bacterium]